MPVPGFQELMLPMLQIAADDTDHKISEMVAQIADHFHLTESDRDQRLSSGQPVLYNRTHWAATYLAKAQLLERSGRGSVRITERGRSILAENPVRVDIKLLSRFPDFEAFRSKTAPVTEAVSALPTDQDPEELLDSTFSALRRTVETDLLDHVLASTPEFFEHLVLTLLRAMGYGGSQPNEAFRHVGRTGDDGIDGVIDEDRLGLDAVYIQAKRWAPDHPVRRPDLQGFAGSLEGQRATKGVFLTTSRFTEDAKEYTGRIGRRIVLVDGARLARLMYDHGVGVRQYRTYEVRRVDTAFFEGEA